MPRTTRFEVVKYSAHAKTSLRGNRQRIDATKPEEKQGGGVSDAQQQIQDGDRGQEGKPATKKREDIKLNFQKKADKGQASQEARRRNEAGEK